MSAMDIDVKEYSLAETKRHKPCLIYRGYRYVQDKIQNRTVYWRCEDRAHCNGRAHQFLSDDSLPVLTIQHNHSPFIEDLTKHDIVSVDSHRRRRRHQSKAYYYSREKHDFLLTINNMTSSIKLETNLHKYRSQQEQRHTAAMTKNLHLSEVITTTAAAASQMSHLSPIVSQQRNTINPIEMTKLLNNITTSSQISAKKSAVAPSMDYPSRLNQFSWEEIEGRYIPVIFRTENNLYQRYTSKMFVENTIFQNESWQKHLSLARSLPPLVSYTYTEAELKLFRFIIAWHLASFYFKTLPSTDCLIRFDDLLDFYNTLRKRRDNIPTPTNSSFNQPIEPVPTPIKTTKVKSDIPSNEKTSKESGWVQINNVFVPYIIKVKLRDNDLLKSQTRQSLPQLQREFYVPYEILIKCNIFSDTEFAFKKLLIKATQQDFDILNNLITNINIFDEKVPEKTLLVNLYHVMVGLNRILYIKFLPTKQPRTQVNKYHADVLTHKGGTLIMNGNKLIPYIVQNNRFYVPLFYTFHSLPNILLQAKRGARAPRQYEVDYLNLLFIYFYIDTPPLTSDTLLVDIFNIKCQNLQTPIHFRTLNEHHQHEKGKLLNLITHCIPTQKSSNSSTTTTKSSKYPPANVVVNPMIHHPSFYGLPSGKTVTSFPTIKTIVIENRTLNAIVKSADQSISDWKISVKEIFDKFSFDIDYERFILWCQNNHLVPLVKLNDDESHLRKVNTDDEYFVYQQHLDRCIALLNDLKRSTISMTLVPDAQEISANKLSLAGAKKRKTTVPTTRNIHSTSTVNESDTINTTTNTTTTSTSGSRGDNGQDDECLSAENQTTGESVSVEETQTESTNEQIICSDIADLDDGDDSRNNNNNSTVDRGDGDDDDDDDSMPVVAFVEEEQPIDETHPTESNTPFVIVEKNDDQDEQITLDEHNHSCSSISDSTIVLNAIDNTIQENNNNNNNTDERDSDPCTSEQLSPCQDNSQSQSPQIVSKKTIRKRPRNIYMGKSRARSRSLKLRHAKKPRLLDDHENDDEQSSLIVIITSEKIEQHLRTLFMMRTTAASDLRRTRTRPIKTPTRLVEENLDNSTTKIIEPDSNVFDILSSTTIIDTMNSNEATDDSQNSCTYNIVQNNQANKLGMTIKKVAST